jgi:hypothetical protein
MHADNKDHAVNNKEMNEELKQKIWYHRCFEGSSEASHNQKMLQSGAPQATFHHFSITLLVYIVAATQTSSQCHKLHVA